MPSAAAGSSSKASEPARPPAAVGGGGGGATSGLLPNIHVRGIGMDTVRVHPDFIALPPVDQLVLGSPQCYRYVRQDSPLWRALHAGVLTSSTLNGALGVYELGAVARLGLPRHFASHRSLAAAVANLQHPQHVPPPPLRSVSPAEADRLNRAAVAAHNAAATAPAAPAAQPVAGRQHGKTGSRRKKPKDGARPATDEARLRSTAVALAERGVGSIRMAWGSAQEPAAVHSLLEVFPEASVGEVGLCMVDTTALPREWGLDPGLLPPMGASPDAMLRHMPAAPPAAQPAAAHTQSAPHAERSLVPVDAGPSAGQGAQHATGSAMAATAAAPASAAAAASAATGGDQSRRASAAAQAAAQTAAQWAANAATATGAARSAGAGTAVLTHTVAAAPGISAVGAAAGPTGRPLQLAQDIGPPAAVQLPPEWGAKLSAPAAKQRPGNGRSALLPAARRQATARAGSQHAQQAERPTALAADIEALLQRLQLGSSGQSGAAPAGAMAGDRSGSTAAVPAGARNQSASFGSELPQQQQQQAGPAGDWEEMVEVKNTCPFASKPRLSRKGKQQMHYILADKGPRTQVPSYWVAQLQMEMLASGTHSIVLLSRSVTKGSNVFRMQRDDTFLRLMLGCIQQLMVQYVLPGRSPPANCFANSPQHHQMLSRMLHVVAATPVIAHMPHTTPHPAAVDGRFFLS